MSSVFIVCIYHSVMMANVLISEVLCFISNNFEKQPASQLKPVTVRFYNEDQLKLKKY